MMMTTMTTMMYKGNYGDEAVFPFFLCHWWTWYIRDKLITQSTFLSITLSFPIILLYDHLIFSWILSNILFLTCDFYFLKKILFFQIDSDNYKIKQTRLACLQTWHKNNDSRMFVWFLLISPRLSYEFKNKTKRHDTLKKGTKKNQFSFLKS